jgi:hypothetical protein
MHHTVRGLVFLLSLGGIIVFIIGFAELRSQNDQGSLYTAEYLLALLGAINTFLYVIYFCTRHHHLFAGMFILALLTIGFAGAVANWTGIQLRLCGNCPVSSARPLIMMLVGSLCVGVAQILLPWTQHNAKHGYIQI